MVSVYRLQVSPLSSASSTDFSTDSSTELSIDLEKQAESRIMAAPGTSKLVSRALAQSRKIIESDTEVTTIDLNLLANLNTNQSLNYIKLESHLTAIEKDLQQRQALEEEIAALKEDLEHIERNVSLMGELVSELDQWSRETGREG